jgi:hypothetical protein
MLAAKGLQTNDTIRRIYHQHPGAFSIGDSKMAWEPTWSPDGNFIAFVITAQS